jgi:pSer/pThr/pTyr-binding forkhead associated (FHA) protein
MVVTQRSAESFATLDRTTKSANFVTGLNDVVGQSLMISFGVIVLYPPFGLYLRLLAKVLLKGKEVFGELIPCGGGDPIPLMRSKLLVGRKSFCDVTLPYANVSSQHCELQLKDGFWHVRDLGSTNGVRVDGQPCTSDWLLPGDELSVASHRYTIHYSPPQDRPPPKRQKAGPAFEGGLAELAGVSDEKPDVILDRRPRSSNADFGELLPVGGGEPIALSKANLTVGRHGSCDIAMPYSIVSARHCELEFKDGHWRVRDLGSRNGTFVDGQRCESRWLNPGDVLSVAKYRYKLVYTPEGDAPPPEEDKADFSLSLLDKLGMQRKKK